MELLGSYTFNRGQEIDIWKGPKSYRLSLYLFHAKGWPWKHIVGRDLTKLLYRGLSILRDDVAKDRQVIELAESEGMPFPIKVRTEQDVVDEIVHSPRVQEALGKMVSDIQFHWELDKISVPKELRGGRE